MKTREDVSNCPGLADVALSVPLKPVAQPATVTAKSLILSVILLRRLQALEVAADGTHSQLTKACVGLARNHSSP